ncbi:RNA-directed DNA polymerase, eukaryota [Tanacetum coccineum]|uniref:RNA-directed DNA polymerase, eukaryota n=1 Tax=Tanacetum coccineum TaxID=301880 RepID=A0ABQ5F752_9ASTR
MRMTRHWVASWFARLCNAQEDFVSRERIVWVDIEGVPLRAVYVLKRHVKITSWKDSRLLFEGYEIKDMAMVYRNLEEESDIEAVSDTVFGDSIDNNTGEQEHSNLSATKEGSYDPFNIYDLLNKAAAQAVDDNPSPVPNAINKRSKTGGSILDLLDELIKVGNTMGYSLDGCANDWENIIDAVKLEDERMGSVFNVRGARDFNNFITSAGLVDVQLEGYAFTWSHPSAAKMSKLDRFIWWGLMMTADGAEGFGPKIQDFQMVFSKLGDYVQISLKHIGLSSDDTSSFIMEQAMVFKVDFAKAYDSVRWDFLDDVLEAFGFGFKWRSWVLGSLSSGMASIVINGSPTAEFKFHCGLKQGFGVSREMVNDAASSLGCAVMRAPFKYLGVMVGVREIQSLNSQGIDLLSFCRIRVGNGLQTRFWKDHWIGDAPLYDLFPRLFSLEMSGDVTVATKLHGLLSDSFRRPVRGGIEAQQLAHLQNLVGTSILSNSDDRWVCNLNGDGSFQVKNIRCLLDEYFLPNDPVATRWVKFIPIRISFRLEGFTWMSFNG